MNGTSSSVSNHSGTASRRIEGANGRKDSRRLILRLRMSFMSARRGSPRIERLPSARGPHSMRPWNQPITLPSEIACAVRRHSVASSAMRSMRAARRVEIGAPRGDGGRDLVRRRRRAPVGVVHHEVALGRRARRLVPGGEGRADRAAGIAAGRLDVELLERRALEHLAVGHRVVGTAARQHDGIGAVARMQRVQQVEEGVLVGHLGRARDVAVLVLERRRRIARRPEQLHEFVAPQAAARGNAVLHLSSSRPRRTRGGSSAGRGRRYRHS